MIMDRHCLAKNTREKYELHRSCSRHQQAKPSRPQPRRPPNRQFAAPHSPRAPTCDLNSPMNSYLNRLLQQCNQAAMRNDITTGIELYTRAINDTSDSYIRNFLLTYLRALHLLLNQTKTRKREPLENPRNSLELARRVPDTFCRQKKGELYPSFLYELTLLSEEIFLSSRKVQELSKRATLLSKFNFFYGSCVDCRIISRAASMGPQSWIEIGGSAMRCGFEEMLLLVYSHLRAGRYDLRQLHVREAILKQNYGLAITIIDELKPKDNPTQFTQGMMNMFLGDVMRAMGSYVSIESLRWKDEPPGLWEPILFLSHPEIPLSPVRNTPVGKYLFYVSLGAYQSLTMSLIDVPIELFVPWQVQSAWIAKKDVDITGMLQNSFPDDFNKNPIDARMESLLITEGYGLGLIINYNVANVRQHICCGLAFVQLVQYLHIGSMFFSMEKAVSSIGHWIRMYDPTACLFPRTNNSFVAYVARNGVCIKQMEPFQDRVFKMLKNGLAMSSSPQMAAEIKAAATPEDLYDLLMGDVCIKIGDTDSCIAMKMGRAMNVDLCVAVPPDPNEWHNRFAQLSAIWSHLMLVFNSKRTSEAASDFLEHAIRWVFEWMQLCPYVDGSNIIGAIVFHSLVCAYFNRQLTSTTLTPFAMQMEALLAANFSVFKAIIQECYQTDYDRPIATRELPRVSDIFPTYHHRHVALYKHCMTDEFRTFFDSMRLVCLQRAKEELEKADNTPESV